MRTDETPTIRLEDYRPADFLIDTVDLVFKLDPVATRVVARLSIRPNPAGQPDVPLHLDGDELKLVSVALDGTSLTEEAFSAAPQGFTLLQPPRQPFVLTLETEINPTTNTKLMGLYRSNGIYCTQCEAEGFRRITYFLDRPDVLSVYTTRIEAAADTPLLLGNGNPVETGSLPDNRHFAVWHDPFPKPSYLFALVGGQLDKVSDTFVTMGGRKVEVAIYVEPGKRDRAHYALDALMRSMRWDEQVYGREYDLDVFNVVAVSDFNMGAMENKGLNIFNDKYVLASEETTTDADYANVESVIAHEYFHNWTGNRITCRDWFQLCLKEGLTVFRDQEFSSDMRSRPVQRIGDVRVLRSRQFPEDTGPLSHPVRPRAYKEINNFYTATVYEKGAELIRMLKTLIGDDAFHRGMDLYFARYDGTAATIEQFLECFAEASGRDLTHFAQWYEQAGTPRLKARGSYDADARTFSLTLSQQTLPTPGQPEKQPVVIPVVLGLVGESGAALPLRVADVNVLPTTGDDTSGMIVLDSAERTVIFTDVAERPVPSLLRGFSAPVTIDSDLTDDDLLTLFARDSDPFNQWQAAQTVATRLIVKAVEDVRTNQPVAATPRFAQALAQFLDTRARQDPAFAAQVLAFPGEADIAREIGRDIDPAAILTARRAVRRGPAVELSAALNRLYAELEPAATYSPDAAQAGRRALRNAVLDLITAGDPARGAELARAQYAAANNMTDRLGALSTLTHVPGEEREAVLRDFGERYGDNPLVLDKWFALQAAIPEDGTLDRVRGLMNHPAFSLANPNRTRALVGSFAMANASQFARPDGAGFHFLAEMIIQLDPRNPQIASRLATAFGTWRMLEAGRRAHAESALRRIAETKPLSVDVADIVGRALA